MPLIAAVTLVEYIRPTCHHLEDGFLRTIDVKTPRVAIGKSNDERSRSWCICSQSYITGCIVGVGYSNGKGITDGTPSGIGSGDSYGNGTYISVQRSPSEGLGGGIKAEPGWQSRTVTQGGGVSEAVPNINIVESVDRHGKAKGTVFIHALIGKGIGQSRGIINIIDGDRKALSSRQSA